METYQATCQIADMTYLDDENGRRTRREKPARHPARIRACVVEEKLCSIKDQAHRARGHLYQAFGIKEIRHAWKKNNGPLKNSKAV